MGWSEADEPARSAADAQRLLYVVRRCYAAVKARLDDIARRYDITTGEFTILSFLRQLEPCSAAALARALRVTPQAVTQQVAQLRAKGLITSEASVANRRISLISRTETGRASLAAVNREARALEKALMAGLDPAQREALFAGLVHATHVAETGEYGSADHAADGGA